MAELGKIVCIVGEKPLDQLLVKNTNNGRENTNNGIKTHSIFQLLVKNINNGGESQLLVKNTNNGRENTNNG